MSVVVSCVSTRVDILRSHWRRAGEDAERPLGVLGSRHKPLADLGGALCLASPDELTTVEMWMPAAICPDGSTLLVTTPWAVRRVDTGLATIDSDVFDLPLLNAVHWIAPSRGGWLLACSGLDLLVEVSARGEVLWEWWAVDHGFGTDPLGRARLIDRDADHRGVDYGTLAQTTHVNSVAECADGSVLATLFHQGLLIRIDRVSGAWSPVLDDLRHPHAVRSLGGDRFSVADTGRGEVVIVDGLTHAGVAARAATDWLQDACFDRDRDRWLLVDGRNARLVTVPATGDAVVTQFDPLWRLYSAVPLEVSP